jgi:beta-galactosidase
MRLKTGPRLAALAGGALFAFAAHGETVLRVDASAPVPEPVSGHIRLGTARAPDGSTLGINNQYLTRNGQPWLPVMGEFHYSRSPADSWEAELLKMKAAGIDIVASYVMWDHHEERDGEFDWSGNRDLRRFVQLAAKAGLDVVVRIGPWVHAEVRYGGIPDWVVNAMPTRGDDPQYLQAVERLYTQIGRQLDGQLWKQGGRVIGIQLENEYNLNGPGQGAGHMATLKRLALKAGLDVPLYTATAWDGALYPSGEITPVFGGYPDAPWATSSKELPPSETYAFRFDSRVSGDLGAQTAAHSPGTAMADMGQTPFLGAEYGAGLPAMYRRRTLVSPDDIGAMLPVQLGSGVNLMGYYMFHGGRNPVGRTTLEESTLSGGYNDTPLINYDFNAPLGPDGQQRPVLEKLRPFHYFVHDFGARLAPMTVRKPEQVPASPADLAAPRFSVRSKGDSGFLFLNNHVRQYPMAPQKGVRFAVNLPGGLLEFPARPIDVPDNAYFVWPFNFDLDGTRLVYATVQPVARLDNGSEGVAYVFGATQDVDAELAFDAAAASCIKAPQARVTPDGTRIVVDRVAAGTSAALTLNCPGARPVTVIVLTPAQLGQLAIGEFGGRRRLVLSEQQAYFDKGRLQLRSAGQPRFRAAVFPPLGPKAKASAALAHAQDDGLFQVLEAALPERSVQVTVTLLREARKIGAPALTGPAKSVVQPSPESFRAAAAWQVAVQPAQLAGLDGALLDIDFAGDIGRLFSGTRMLDDWYYNGQLWQFDLGRLKAELKSPLTVTVLPLRADTPVYLPREHLPAFDGKAQIAALRKVGVTPVYRLSVWR